MHFWRFWEAWGGGVFAVSATQAVCQAEQRPADGPTRSSHCYRGCSKCEAVIGMIVQISVVRERAKFKRGRLSHVRVRDERALAQGRQHHRADRICIPFSLKKYTSRLGFVGYPTDKWSLPNLYWGQCALLFSTCRSDNIWMGRGSIRRPRVSWVSHSKPPSRPSITGASTIHRARQSREPSSILRKQASAILSGCAISL
jgi:hypothetical protein